MKGWKDLVEEKTTRRVTVAGRVTDASTKLPIVDAAVKISAASEVTGRLRQETTTDREGRYYFLNFQPGDYRIEVSADRYEVRDVTVTVPSKGERRLMWGEADFALNRR